jgi:hypothetical protein
MCAKTTVKTCLVHLVQEMFKSLLEKVEAPDKMAVNF